MIKWRVAARAETTVTGLAFEGLDMSILATLPITDQRMNSVISHAEIQTVWIQAGMSLRLDKLLPSTIALLAS